MTPLSAPMLPTGSLPASHGTDRERLATAARQFEAIFVRQVLAEARKSHFGGGLFGEGSPDSAIGTFRTMQDNHVAELAADRGAFGLAAMIERQLLAQVTPQGASTSSAGAGTQPALNSAQAEPVEAPTASPKVRTT